MPFIGKTPETGAFRLIDSITTSATDTYALTVEGDHYFPESARNLIVSLNGVTQAPEAAYTVSGSHIVFASALTSSDVIDYILVIGEAVDIGTPSDNTVGNAQLKSSLDLSGKTLTFSADQVSGDAINGGTISNFASTGIDDNANDTAITIDASENVGIGTGASISAPLHIGRAASGTYSVFDDGVNGRFTFASVTGTTNENRIFSTTTGFAGYEDLNIVADNFLFSTGSPTGVKLRIASGGDATFSGTVSFNTLNNPINLYNPEATPYYTIGVVSSGNIEYDTYNRHHFKSHNTADPYTVVVDEGDALVNGVRVGLGAGQVGTNTALGGASLSVNTTGVYNTAVGFQALVYNTTGSFNTAVGLNALLQNTTGGSNTAVGQSALVNNTTGSANSAFGSAALNLNTTGVNNTAVGHTALERNTTGIRNTAFGVGSLKLNTTGTDNDAFGVGALQNSNNNYNAAFGRYSLHTNTSGYNNVAVGANSSYANTSGNRNTSVGMTSLASNTTGSFNTACGYASLANSTTSLECTAVGYNALYSVTTGNSNTAVGRNAGSSVTTGVANVIMGESASANLTTGIYNTVIGKNAGLSNISSNSNSFFGREAGRNTTSDTNTFIGQNSGYYITTGANNVILGSYNGNQGGLDLRTSHNNTVLADGHGNPRAYFSASVNEWRFLQNGGEIRFRGHSIYRSGSFGSGIHFSTNSLLPANELGNPADNTEVLGGGNYRWKDAYITNSVTTGSDERYKQDISSLSEAEARVAVACKGLLRKWRWKDAVEAKDNNPDSDEVARIHFGIIAQDLKASFEAEGLDAGRYGMFIHDTWTDEETGEERDRMGIRYSELLAFIISAI